MRQSLSAIVSALVSASTAVEAQARVAELEAAGCLWVPLGGKEGNFGLVNIGSDPVLAFVERMTNALDGVLERTARDRARTPRRSRYPA